MRGSIECIELIGAVKIRIGEGGWVGLHGFHMAHHSGCQWNQVANTSRKLPVGGPNEVIREREVVSIRTFIFYCRLVNTQ